MICKYCQNVIDGKPLEKVEEKVDKKTGDTLYKCPSCKQFNNPSDCGCSI